jgi:hypothetical protein
MRLNIDALMIILLIALIGSFVTLLIYGEVWRISLSMTDMPIESYDRGHTQTAFIVSCVCIASGASMLYLIGAQFSEDNKKKDTLSAR